MSKIMKIAGLGLLAVVMVAAALAVPGVAAAQEPDPTTPPTGTGMYYEYQDEIHAALADALGLTVSEFEAKIDSGMTLSEIAAEQGVAWADVQAVMLDARADVLAEMVAEGIITQEQADWMTARRGMFGIGGMRGYGMGLMFQYQSDIHTALADALGLTVDEFDAMRADGMTLVEIAAAQGVDVADAYAAMTDVRADMLAEMVADGVITQEQADWMLSHMASGMGYGAGSGVGGCFNGTGMGMRGGIPGGSNNFGMGMGGGLFNNGGRGARGGRGS